MCRFDHPMGTMSYSPPTSSLADMPVAPYTIGSSLATLAPSSTPELRAELLGGSNQNSFSTRMTSMDNTSSTLAGSIFSRSGSGSHPSFQLSGQSSSSLGGSSSGGHGSDVRS